MKKERIDHLAKPSSYAVTRLDYFVGKALQGLLVGRAERDLRSVERRALEIGKEMKNLLDS